MRILVRQHRRIGRLRLAHDAQRTRLIQKNIIYDARPPRIHAMRPTERRISHERVAAAVVVARVVMRAVVVLLRENQRDSIAGKRSSHLRPVHLEVGEGRVVEPAEEAEHVRVFVQAPQVRAVLVQRARLVPPFRDARVVLPLVEEGEVALVAPVDGLQREVLVERGDVAAVDDGAGGGLGRAHRVARVDALAGELHGEGVVLGEWGVRADGPSEMSVRAIADGPDGARAEGAAGALPEGGAADEELLGGRFVFALVAEWCPLVWVLECEAGADELLAEDILAAAGQCGAELLMLGIDDEEGVDDVPDLTERWWHGTAPFECSDSASPGLCPRAVVLLWRYLTTTLEPWIVKGEGI